MKPPKAPCVCVTVLSVFCGVSYTSEASAAIEGTNAALDANGRSLYIPLTHDASGTLGEADTALVADSAVLRHDGDTTRGWTSFVLDFDLTDALAPDERVSPAWAVLTLTVDDLDFQVDADGGVELRESLTMSFLPHGTGSPDGADLRIDESNFMDFLLMPAGFDGTDDRTLCYRISLEADMGLTDEDFAAINRDRRFGIFLQFEADAVSRRSGRICISNTAESFRNTFGATATPEPSTLLVLFAGAVPLILRRWRRSR
jgi:hypothetical protein